MSARAGWYPDPGGAPGLFRYWDGRAWSAATSPNPAAPPPAVGLVESTAAAPPAGTRTPAAPGGSAYAAYRQTAQRKSPVGWWVAGGVLLLVLIAIAVIAVRAVGGGGITGVQPGGPASSDVCPPNRNDTPTGSPEAQPNDGRVHGGPLSYPVLGSPWGPAQPEYRVPFGLDAVEQSVLVEPNYNGEYSNWVASVVIGELQAGDGFFTPQQGAQIVVRCVIGAFYGDAEVTSDVKVNRATTIDQHDAWLVESQLSFDIPNLRTKGELLIVAIVATGSTAGLYYASIPDTRPELVAPARQALAELTVDS